MRAQPLRAALPSDAALLRPVTPSQVRTTAKPAASKRLDSAAAPLVGSVLLMVFALGFATGRQEVFHFIGVIAAGLAGLVAGLVIAAGVVLGVASARPGARSTAP